MTHSQKVVKVIQEVPVHPSGMDKNKMEWALLRVPLYKSQEALRKWGLCIQGAPVLRAAKLLNLLLHSAPGWLTNLEQQPLCGHTCTWPSPCGLLSPPWRIGTNQSPSPNQQSFICRNELPLVFFVFPNPAFVLSEDNLGCHLSLCLRDSNLLGFQINF